MRDELYLAEIFEEDVTPLLLAPCVLHQGLRFGHGSRRFQPLLPCNRP